FDDIEQRVQRPVRIPKAKGSIVGKAFGLVYVLIKAFVPAVNVHINGRVYHGMVHRGIKILLVILAAFYYNFMQFSFPQLLAVVFYLVKVPARYFGLHIVQRAVDTYRRYGKLDLYLFAF